MQVPRASGGREVDDKMVLDTFDNAAHYETLNPRFARAFRWLRETDLLAAAAGRHDIDGDAVYALIQDVTTKPREQGVWEAHRRYLDIQAPLTGEEAIGYAPIDQLKVTQAFDVAKDFCLLEGDGVLLRLRPGMFSLLWPQDGHMPGIAVGAPAPIRKVVVKVLV